MKQLPLVFFIFTLLLTACGGNYSAIGHSFNNGLTTDDSSAPSPEPTEPGLDSDDWTPDELFKMSYRWDGKNAASDDWTVMTSEAFDKFGLLSLPVPRDIADFCPRYNELSKLERRHFWIYLISSMVQLESSFRPQTFYQEAFKDNTGNFVVSRGLLQLSIESSKGYKCPIQKADELHDPATNLECGVRILTYFVKKDGVITAKDNTKWLGGARYWAVLRASASKIKAWTTTTELCR